MALRRDFDEIGQPDAGLRKPVIVEELDVVEAVAYGHDAIASETEHRPNLLRSCRLGDAFREPSGISPLTTSDGSVETPVTDVVSDGIQKLLHLLR